MKSAPAENQYITKFRHCERSEAIPAWQETASAQNTRLAVTFREVLRIIRDDPPYLPPAGPPARTGAW